MSFREKSLWLTVIALVVVFGLYFAAVLPAQATDVQPDQVVLFTALVVLLVVVEIVGHIVLAVVDRHARTNEDERDRLIALVGTRNAAYVLATGVFFALCVALFGGRGNFAFAHVLLGFWVLSEVVGFGSQLVLYRRGV